MMVATFSLGSGRKLFGRDAAIGLSLANDSAQFGTAFGVNLIWVDGLEQKGTSALVLRLIRAPITRITYSINVGRLEAVLLTLG